MPTRWTVPAEPGAEVTAVQSDMGTTFIRDTTLGEWVSLPADGHPGGWRVKWHDIVVFGLTDVSAEFDERSL